MRTVFRNSEIPGRIHALQPFLSVGRLPDGTRVWSGHSGPAASLGHLPARLHASARSAVYVVYSYATPIAWVTESEDPADMAPYVYHLPNIGYSLVTGQQQYSVADAWKVARRKQYLRRGSDIRVHTLDGRREVVRLPATAEAYGVPRRPRSGGVDGLRPGDVIGSRSLRTSAYEGVGADASHWSPPEYHSERNVWHRAHP